jgi:hypothetical protein
MADFLKEVEVISNLRHPNIVLYMGVCLKKLTYYLITEFLYYKIIFKISGAGEFVRPPAQKVNHLLR